MTFVLNRAYHQLVHTTTGDENFSNSWPLLSGIPTGQPAYLERLQLFFQATGFGN